MLLALLVALLLLGSGCAKKVHTGGTASVVTPDFFGLGEDVALQLASSFRKPTGKGMKLILTTVVDIDDLYETSRFGRTARSKASASGMCRGVTMRRSSVMFRYLA